MQFPDYVKKILSVLQSGGYEAYVVGGCVRDCIMGRRPHDFDIASSASPEQVSRLFEKTLPTGFKYGTVTVITEGGRAEVTAFRRESGYTDGRRPSEVSFDADITSDLARRDFTVNALAADIDGNITDPLGGIRDISAKIIRCVGEPEQRFCEDALRILRAFRFAAELGFDIEEKTLTAAIQLSPGLMRISAERISAELMKTLAAGRPSVLAPLIDSGGLAFTGIKKAASLGRLDGAFKNAGMPAYTAAFCSVCGLSTDEFCENLRLPSGLKKQSAAAQEVIKHPPRSRGDIKRAMRDTGGVLRGAVYMSCIINGLDYEYYNSEISDILKRGEAYKTDMLNIRGGDLVSLGVPAENIGTVLRHLLECVTENPDINKKERLIAAAEKFMQNGMSG